MGIYGYSRGGMAASLLALDLGDVKAAVLGAGIYDSRRRTTRARSPAFVPTCERRLA
jgi:dipeptidyl aminopeptidase/acylaminoacyl peptidase